MVLVPEQCGPNRLTNYSIFRAHTIIQKQLSQELALKYMGN